MEVKKIRSNNNIWNKFVNKFFDSHNYSSRRKFYNSSWSIALSIFVTAIIILFFGYNPFDVFLTYLNESNLSNIFIPTIVSFVFASLAISICFKSGFFNIGVSGQMMISGIITLFFIRKSVVDNGVATHGTIILSILLSMLLCVLVSLVIGALKVYLNINEVVSSIMINWIIFFLIRYIVELNTSNGLLSDEILISQEITQGYGSSQLPSFYFIDFGLWYKSAWSWTLIFLAIASCITIWIIFKYTKFGYKVKMVGLSVNAADYSGTNRKNLILITMTISGILSSLAGFVWYFSTQQGQLSININSGPLYVGFNAIAISLIVFDNPIAIIFSSIIFSIISVGSQASPDFTQLPNEMTDIISGIFIYIAALAFIFSKFLPYQWTRNFIVLVRYKKYRSNYWKNWNQFLIHKLMWFREKQELIKLWKNHHNEWNKIKKESKNKIYDEEKKILPNSKFIFNKLSNDHQIEYLNFLAKEKKERDLKLSEANFFEKNVIKSKRKEKYISWKQDYLEIKKEIINYHFKIREEKLYDSTYEMAIKEKERIENKKKGDE